MPIQMHRIPAFLRLHDVLLFCLVDYFKTINVLEKASRTIWYNLSCLYLGKPTTLTQPNTMHVFEILKKKTRSFIQGFILNFKNRVIQGEMEVTHPWKMLSLVNYKVILSFSFMG